MSMTISFKALEVTSEAPCKRDPDGIRINTSITVEDPREILEEIDAQGYDIIQWLQSREYACGGQ